MDEFETIARLFRPLSVGAPEALDLKDDAAVIPGRPGFDLVVTKDAMVEGVHFLGSDAPEAVARKLLRVNLSDLAAKAAEPYGYFLAVAWPPQYQEAQRRSFAKGLGDDQRLFGLRLFGGDTVSTPGPLTLSATVLGWTPAGRLVKRSQARPGAVALVSGAIGDGFLGLKAAQGRPLGLPQGQIDYLVSRYACPTPRLSLRAVLRAWALAAADVSDGLLADAGHIAEASGLGLILELDRMPLSPAGRLVVEQSPDPCEALMALAAGGDDYEIVMAVDPDHVDAAVADAAAAGVALTAVGRFTAEGGLRALHRGLPAPIQTRGWRHG